MLVADGEPDRINDMQLGQDLIDISAWDAFDMQDLSITGQSDGTLLVTSGDETLTVKQKGGAALAVGDLEAQDFVFTPAAAVIDFQGVS